MAVIDNGCVLLPVIDAQPANPAKKTIKKERISIEFLEKN